VLINQVLSEERERKCDVGTAAASERAKKIDGSSFL